MKHLFKASKIKVTKVNDQITYEAVETDSALAGAGGCQVGGDSSDPDNPYCIDNGCGNCVLHSQDNGDGSTSYWCTCG